MRSRPCEHIRNAQAGGITILVVLMLLVLLTITVFGLSKNAIRENIIAGIHDAAASRVYAMAQRVKASPPIMMTGGVAKNIGIVKALERKFATTIEVNAFAQVNGAIGAAVLAARM